MIISAMQHSIYVFNKLPKFDERARFPLLPFVRLSRRFFMA